MSTQNKPIVYYPTFVRIHNTEARISSPQMKFYTGRTHESCRDVECCCSTCCKICANNFMQQMPSSCKPRYSIYDYNRSEPMVQCGPSCTCQKVSCCDRTEIISGRNSIISSRRDQLEAMMDEMSSYHTHRQRYLHPVPHIRGPSKYHQLYKSAFTAQIDVDRETKPKRFPCMYCDKSFGKSSHLRDHVRTHTGERPFRCSWCDKAFTQYSNLRTHMRIHTGEKPYSCKYCLKSFTQAVTLRSHLRTHNEEEEKTGPF